MPSLFRRSARVRQSVQIRQAAQARRAAQRRRRARQHLFELLECRHLLASDFVYDYSAGVGGLNATFEYDATNVRLVNNANSLVLRTLPVNDFTGVVRILGANLYSDVIQISPPGATLASYFTSITIDGQGGDDQISIVRNVTIPGADISLMAETISVAQNISLATESTNSASGDIALTGVNISLGLNSSLRAASNNGFAAGDVTIAAQLAPLPLTSGIANAVLPLLITNNQTSIQLSDVQITGGNVTITANSATDTRFDELGDYADNIARDMVDAIGLASDLAVSLVSPISGQVKIQKAASSILLNNSTITASGTVSVDATSTADASFDAVGINSVVVPVPVIAVIGYGQTETKSNINLTGTTSITADGDVSIHSTVEAQNDISSRGMGNARISNSDNVDVAVSVAMAFNNFESTITTGANTVIRSNRGSLSIHAAGDNEVASQADSILFRDGIAGIALTVAVDTGTVRSTINGTLIASNPQGTTSYSFNASQVVNVSEDSITLSGIAENVALERGDTLIYNAGPSAINGLVNGQEVVVADVENVPSGDEFTGVQKIRLAKTLPLDIGNEAVLANSTQSLGKILLATFPSSAVAADANNNLTINLPGITNGTKLTYKGPNSPVTETNIDATFARSPAGDTITRDGGGTDWKDLGLYPNQQIELVAAGTNNSRVFTIASFSTDGRSLILREANTVEAGAFKGFTLKTTPAAPAGIGNLTQNTEYTAAIVGGRVLLRDPANPANFIRFTSAGTGIHGFRYVSNTQTFAPAIAVDPDRDTIRITNHGFQTGDLLVYRTDPSKSSDMNVYNFDSRTPGIANLIGTAELPDTPIDGMRHGLYYFVTRVDANHIRLSENPVAARNAVVIDLTGSPTGTHSFSLPDKAVGIEILATLSTKNATGAGAELSDGEQPWADVIFNSPNRPENMFLGLVNMMPFAEKLRTAAAEKKAAEEARDPLDKEGHQDSGIPLEFAGCFAINVFNHTVETRIGSTAKIFSAKDLLIQSTIEEMYSSAVSSETTRNGLDGADTSDVTSKREDVEISIAFSLVSGTNHVQSIVADGANLNAKGSMSIDSKLEYPLLIDDANAIINPAKAVKEEGLDGFQFLLDGTLGLASLFNTSVAAIGGDPGSNRADIFVLGAAFNLTFMNNRSLASVGAGALINQDGNWLSDQQSLSVTASTNIETVDVDQNAVFNLSVPALAEIGGDVLKDSRTTTPGDVNTNPNNKDLQVNKAGQIKSTLRSIVNPFGISGQNAIGPSFIFSTRDNVTVAEIKDGAKIRTGGLGSGVTVLSTQDILSVAVAQTGATASEFGLTLSAAIDRLVTETRANIGNNVSIIAPALNVNADDNVERYAIAGSYVFGEKIGIGISFGLNNHERTVLAYIGSPSPTTDATTGAAHIVIDGETQVTAHQGGNTFVLGMAGALLNDPDFVPAPEQPPTKPPADPVAGVTIAVGASIAYNKAKNRVEAFIDDPSITTESLKISAVSDYEMRSIMVGGAVGTRKADTSFGIGGAFSINNIETVTRAFVRDANIVTNGFLNDYTTKTGVLIEARDNTILYADGGGIALMFGRGLRTSNNIAIGIGFSINDISGATESFTEDTTIQSLGGGVLTQAVYDSSIVAVSIGGAGAISTNGSGNALNLTGAGAGSKNAINGTTLAQTINSDIIAGTPLGPAPVNHFIGLEAIDLSNIQADAGAVALAVALSSLNQSYNLSFALAVGLNEITRQTQARVSAGSDLTAHDLQVVARSLSVIDSLTIGGTLSAGANSGAFSGAGSGNKLTLTTEAIVDRDIARDTTMTLTGDLSVLAQHKPTIIADAGGFSIALSKATQSSVTGTLSVGIGASENIITSTVQALIVGAQFIGRAEDILISADSSPSINALTMGGSGAGSISNSTAFTIAGAGAGSRNTITSVVNAWISQTTPSVYRGQTITVLANDNSTIVANSGAIALLLTLPSSTNINVSIGVSLAINSITATTISKVDRARLQAEGNLVIASSSQGSISALTIAGAAAAALATGSSSSGLTFSGAGTGSGNNIISQTLTLVEPTSILQTAAGRIDVSATNSSTIDAKAVAGSLSFQSSSGGSVSIGAAIAENKISRDVKALLTSATASAATGLSVTSQATAVIRSLAVGFAASVALNNGQGSFSLAASGAGAQSKNTVQGTLESAVINGARVEINVGDLRVQTLDTSSIFVDAGGGTFAASASTEGGSIAFSISAGVAENKILQSILARIEDANTLINVGGKVDVIASSQSTIDAKAASVAASVAIVNPKDGLALGLAGAGASATNTITNTILASIADRASVTASGTITVRAIDNASILAIVPVISLTFAIGLGASISVTLATNTIGNTVEASILDAVTNTTTGGVIIEAQSTSETEAFATPLAASISVGAAGGGGEAKSIIDGYTKANLGLRSSVTAPNGEVRVSAATTASTRAETKGGSAALVNINAMLASAIVNASTLAQVGNDARITARNLNVVTYGLNANSPGLSSRTANAVVKVGGIGIAGGTGGRAEAKITGTVDAFIDSNSIITITGATIVDAKSASSAHANAEGGGGGGLQISALLADATISGSTSARIASNVFLTSGTLDVLANSTKDSSAKILVATISVVGGNGGKATAIDSASTSTSIGASPIGPIAPSIVVTGNTNLISLSSESVTTDARGGGGGVMQIGGYVAESVSSGFTTAGLENNTRISTGNLKIQAEASQRDVTADLLTAQIALSSLGVISSTTKITGDVTASIGASSTITTPSTGTVDIIATGVSSVDAEGDGGGGGLASISAFTSASSIGNVNDRATTTAVVGNNANLKVGSLNVRARNQTNNRSKLLTVGVGGITSASATADALTFANALARIGNAVQVDAAGSVTVDARSAQGVSADLTTGSGSVSLSLAIAAATSRVEGETQAIVDGGANIKSGLNVNIVSNIESANAASKLVAGVAGALSIGSTRAFTINVPTVLATLAENAKITATGSASVIATGRGEVDSKGESSGGGGVQIGVAYGNATFTPTVKASTAESSRIDATLNVTVNSELIRSSGASVPSDRIQDRSDDADNLAVDVNTDTIDFAFPLSTGNTVIYDSPAGQAPIGGLVDGRAYNVQVVSPGSTIRLGNSFNSSANVDSARDIITFTSPHNFRPGDAVRLNANGNPSIVEAWQTTLPTDDLMYVNPASVLYVRGIYSNPSDPNTLDRYSIRLARTLAEANASDNSRSKSFTAAEVDSVADQINLTDHLFQGGQTVTYRSATATFTTESVDARVVRTYYVDANGIARPTWDVERSPGGAAVHYENNNNIFFLGHLFQTGDAVTYRAEGPAIGGLVNGATYYVIVIDGLQIQLARTYHEAVGLDFDDRGTPDLADDILAIPRTPIAISSAGNQSSAHSLSRNITNLVNGQSYYVINTARDAFKLAATRTGAPLQLDTTDTVNVMRRDGGIAFTLRPVTRGGTHRVGNLGIDLISRSGLQSLVWDLTSQPATNTHRFLNEDGDLLSGLTTLSSDGVSNVTAFGGSGGGIDVAVPTALLRVTPSVIAEVGSLAATLGNISITSISSFKASTYADTNSGGVASIGESHADTLVNAAPTTARVLPGSALTASGNIAIATDSTHSVSARALSKGGGLIGARVAETTARLISNTETVIGRAAKLTAGGLVKLDSEIDLQGITFSETYAVAPFGGADSDNTNDDRGVSITSTSLVTIDTDAQLVAKAIDIKANVAVVNVDATAKATSYSPVLAGVTTSYADAYANIAAEARVDIRSSSGRTAGGTLIRGDEGVDIEATYGPVNVNRYAEVLSVSTVPPQNARRLGETIVGGSIVAQADALVVAGPRYGGYGLLVRNDIPALALYTHAKSIALWNADIRLLSPTYELVLDTAGNVVKQKGISFRRTARSINLDEIVNSGPGQVLFEGGLVNGIATTLILDNAAPRIDITTSFGDLFVNKIQPNAVGVAGLQPKVTIANTINAWEFDVRYDYGPSDISITNNETQDIDFNIRLQGLIDNPLGTTILTSTRDIASASFDGRQGVVRTNRLIGSARNFGLDAVDELDRIPIDIVQAEGYPAFISIGASEDIFVGIQGLNRNPNFSSNFLTMVDQRTSFRAGRDADIMLLAGINQPTTAGATLPAIIVHETATVLIPQTVSNASTNPKTSPRNTTVTDHFRVSTGAAPVLPVGVLGTGTDSIPVTYDLGAVLAGRNINIYKRDTVTSTINIYVDTNIESGAGAGNVDVRTNGFIDLTESIGDLRTGAITSSAGHVTLRSTTGSIIEVPDNGAATGDAAVDIAGVDVTLWARSGAIGSSSKRLDIDSSVAGNGRVFASALASVYLNEVAGNLNVSTIRSELGDLDIVVVSGNLIDFENDPREDLIGNTITLTMLLNNGAQRGNIGTTTNPVEINSSTKRVGGLRAQASGNINLLEVAEELYVLSLSGINNVLPNVFLTVREDASDRNDLILRNVSSVATATFTAGDDFEMPDDAALSSTGNVTINIDLPATDQDLFGGTLTLLGQLISPTARLNSGDDIDLFYVASASTPATIEIFGGSPAFPVYPGDKLKVEPRAANVINTPTSIPLGEGTVTAAGRGTIQYHSIEMIDNAVFNDPPVNLLPPAQKTDAQSITLSLNNGNGLKVLDPDAGEATSFSVTLSVLLGTLTLPNSAALTIFGNGTTQVQLIGKISDINALLDQGVTFTVPAGYSGTTRLNMFSNDGGNTGVGGPLTDSDDLSITIGTDLNEPPVNHYTTGLVSTVPNILLSTANGNGLSVTDSDAGSNGNFVFSIGVDQGIFSFMNTRGLSFTGSGTQQDPFVLISTLAQINSVLAAGVFLNIPENFAGKVRFTMISNDAGATGTDGPQTDTDEFIVNFVDPNIAPVNSLPPAIVTDVRLIELNWRTGHQITVTDLDAGNAPNFSLTLTIGNGILKMRDESLAQFPNVIVTGNRSTNMSLEGTLADINGLMTSGLQYSVDGGFFGISTLTVVSNDAGNTGSPGPLTDTDTLSISLVPDANDPPVNQLPANITTNSTTLVLSAANGNRLTASDPDAGNAVNFEVTLVASVGTLQVLNTNSITAQGNGTSASPLKLTGSLASINFALADGLRVAMPVGFLSTNAIEMLSNDAGNTGPGGPLTDRDAFNITVVPVEVNDPPVNQLPADFTTDQVFTLSAANGNALSVSDPDAGSAANFTVTLGIDLGFLTLVNSGLVQIFGNGNSRSPMILTGTLANINATLAAGVIYARGNVAAGGQAYTLTMVSNDAGNTGVGGPLSDTDVLVINTVPPTSPVNDPPVNNLPAPIVTDRTSILLSQATGNGLSVSDSDAGAANNFSVTLSIPDISIQIVNPQVQLSFSGAGGVNSVRLLGSLAQINQTLANGVILSTSANFTGQLNLTIVSNDAGNTGSGGALTDTDVLKITVTGTVNDPPVNHVPDPITTDRTSIVLSAANGHAISVTDVDAGNLPNFRVELTPTTGTLTLPVHPNVTVSGNGTTASPLVLVGALNFINAALAGGLALTLPVDFGGITTLTVLSNDAGNTGTGGPLSDLDSFPILISGDVNDAPVNSLPNPIATDNATIVLSSALGNALSVVDSDAGDATNFSVQLSVAAGSLGLLSGSGVTAVGVGTSISPLIITGSLTRINAALANGLRVSLPVGFLGNTSLRMVSNDAGNTGLGGPKSDDDSLAITVMAEVNDGPVNVLPPPIVTDRTSIVLSTSRGNALSVVDIDAGNAANFSVTLSIPVGSLLLVNAVGINTSGAGTLAAPLTLTGTLAAINTVLSQGVLINLPGNFSGTTSLIMLSNDNGNTGAGGALTDLDLLSVTVQADVNDPPVNSLPAPVNIAAAPFIFSQANGNAISVSDVDAGIAANFSVQLSIDGALLTLVDLNPTGVTITGDGTLAQPLRLAGTLSNINAALAGGLTVTPQVAVFGTLSLQVLSNDAGNTGSGGPLTDTDYLTINVLKPTNVAPFIVNVTADSTAWVSDFRDFVDAEFGDKQAAGYRVPYGAAQLVSLPWVNIDRLKLTFSEDVGKSLDLSDFSWKVAPGFTALAGTSTVLPRIIGWSYDVTTYTVTLQLGGAVPAAVFDLTVSAAGVFDSEAALLDGEWSNGVTTNKSGNSTEGGDFSFRIFFLPGDASDESNGNGTRTVNTNDSQVVRDRQNGFVLAGVGAVSYDARADLDGSGFINSNDSQLVRDRQAGIIFRQANINVAQNKASQFDVNADKSSTPMDALLIINSLNARTPGLPGDDDNPIFLDVSGDGVVTPLDALMVINLLNAQAVGAEGEAAMASQTRDMAIVELMSSLSPLPAQLGEVESSRTGEIREGAQRDEPFFADYEFNPKYKVRNQTRNKIR